MHKLNILIVEDESIIALEMSDTLKKLGCSSVITTTKPQTAYKYIKTKDINLILMDINLNTDITGIELYKTFNTDTKIIYITAYKDDITIAQAIETNPLGYLIKPHNEDELKVLLKLASYKMGISDYIYKSSNNLITLGESYFFNLQEEKLYFNDVYINLGIKELKLLKILIEAKGSVVSFSVIEDILWNGELANNSTLRTIIYRLRGKLEYKLIKTVFNQGIKLNRPI